MSTPLTKAQFQAEFKQLLDYMQNLQKAKDHDYAGKSTPLANLRLSEISGIEPWVAVAAVRMGDKYSRIANFCKQGTLQVKDESVEDTLMDMAVYSLLAIILLRESKGTLRASETGELKNSTGDGN